MSVVYEQTLKPHQILTALGLSDPTSTHAVSAKAESRQ
jgi:hypothetical protein